MLSQREHNEARALMDWVRMSTGKYPDLERFHHIPNGGARHPAVAGKLKAEGVKRGVSDYFLPAGRGGFFGLYIELKAPGGRPTPAQRKWLRLANGAGYFAVIAVGWQQAVEFLRDYLEQPQTEVRNDDDD